MHRFVKKDVSLCLLPMKRFFCQTNKTNYENKYKNFLPCTNEHSSNNSSFSKYIKIHKIKKYNFIFYGILHGQINEKSCSGKDCSMLIKEINPDYVLLELCENRLNKIFHIIYDQQKKTNYRDSNNQNSNYQNNYSKFTYLPRIHNGFLQNEFIPIVKECLKKQLKIFSCDRDIYIIKNRLDSKLVYNTKAYRNFFTYCTESISLRHYPYEAFTKLYTNYIVDEHKHVNTNNYVHNKDMHVKKDSTCTSVNMHKEGKCDDFNYTEHGKMSKNIIYENLDLLKKLSAMNTMNERLEFLSKPTYEVLIEEKYKYVANNIWCFILNNEPDFFENDSTKNILIICSANILDKLTKEFNSTYIDLNQKYSNNKSKDSSKGSYKTTELIFENPYTSYNNYIKPHWPLIFIKYYIIPYFILYIILNTFYNFCSWVYNSNLKKESAFSHKIIDIEV
ncbi:conserved protein, unknown function [Hepatocystis sp. ex Piliocolobus tephrosceles]|nr:conserved protein, unknown function [Hepatocystis sp. ex Piliocolobus tephrosceles]